MTIQLTADIIEGFAGTFLSTRYDDPRPTPPFHRTVWRLYASSHQQVGCVAPRDHAKSTGFTFDYILAEVCFRTSDYVILIGSTEDKAAEQLSNISEELHTNQDLREEFGIVSFESDQKTEIIVVCDDGHRFRILARGSEQKIRGAMWKGKRPNLIVCDDMEDDEQVENKDRRVKFRRWFFRAVKQALSKKGKIRVHGTILHDDSLLSRLLKNKTWKFLFFKAHASYNDFSNILWQERWTEEELRARRKEFEEDGDAGGYSQEFLNTPLDNDEAYLKKEDFIPMQDSDFEQSMHICAGADFALKKTDISNRTSFTIGGKRLDNKIAHIDQYVGRWDTKEWLDIMFDIQVKHEPEVFYVEDGSIWQSVAPFVYLEMQERDIYINIQPMPSTQDKSVRGRSLQRRMRAKQCLFSSKASWYQDYEQELLKFTTGSQAKLDDQFDSTTILHRGFDTFAPVEEDDFISEEEWVARRYNKSKLEHRSSVTGY